jgi:hypothetical protein
VNDEGATALSGITLIRIEGFKREPRLGDPQLNGMIDQPSGTRPGA